jgi:hypothetical protein
VNQQWLMLIKEAVLLRGPVPIPQLVKYVHAFGTNLLDHFAMKALRIRRILFWQSRFFLSAAGFVFVIFTTASAQQLTKVKIG